MLYDTVFGPESTQKELFARVGAEVIGAMYAMYAMYDMYAMYRWIDVHAYMCIPFFQPLCSRKQILLRYILYICIHT